MFVGDFGSFSGLLRASKVVCSVWAGCFIGMVVECIGGLSWGLSLSLPLQVYSAVVLGLSCMEIGGCCGALFTQQPP